MRVYMYVYMYIYIHIYLERERKRDIHIGAQHLHEEFTRLARD